jgi:formylglycine-generating enzyme
MSYASWTAQPGKNENIALNCSSWQEAFAFCIFDGGFLPSEAEWGYASAGGAQQLEYPWGSADPGTANQYAIYGCNYPNGCGTCVYGQSLAPPGTASLGAGAYGQFDLAGSLTEWTLDYDTNYVDPCTDCAYLSPPNNGSPQAYKVIRGGGFNFNIEYLRGYFRDFDTASGRQNGIGFRCARPPNDG